MNILKFNTEEEEEIWLNHTQAAALGKNIPMTQEIFDSIMELREEIGEEMDAVSMGIFAEYPEFAKAHADRIERETGISDEAEESPLQAQLALIKIKKRIKKETRTSADGLSTDVYLRNR